MGIEFEISRPDHKVFRRCYIRRRSASTGLYETDWQEITKYVKKWGTIDRNIDDVKLNKFVQSGFNFTAINDEGKFNVESNVSSLWYGYMTRYRTLVKVEAGYFDDSQNELPTDSSLGVFIMSDEIPISGETNSVNVRTRSLVSVFDGVRAQDVAGLGATQTASELIEKIRDHTDGSSNFVFRQFITSTAWSIQTTTNYYNFATSTSIGELSCWGFMGKLAEAEGFILLVNRTGGLEFRDRAERTTTSQFSFRGLGFSKQNVISLREHKEAVNKLYTFFRVKYLSGDTSTSYLTSGSVSAVDPNSTIWKYGARDYQFSNTFFANTATAQAVIDNLTSVFGQLKEEISIKTNFVPHLEISDKVLFSYRSSSIQNNSSLWDQFNWDEGSWASENGENLNWEDEPFKILSVNIDLQNFSTTFKCRKI